MLFLNNSQINGMVSPFLCSEFTWEYTLWLFMDSFFNWK